MVYLVTYVLTDDTADKHVAVETALRKIPSWAKLRLGVWLVSDSTMTAAQIRDAIWRDGLSEGDRIFVARLVSEWGSYNFPQTILDWLEKVATF